MVASAGRPFVARLGALTQLVFAALIGGVSALAGSPQPDFVARPLVLLALYALPGLVGLLAIDRRRPGLLVAAGMAAAVGSLIAFSGVTLIFLVPAALMLAGAAAVRPAAATWVGGLVGGARAVLVVSLLLGAGWSALLITDERCWTWKEAPGGVVMEPAPLSTGEMSITVTDVGSGYGCSNGVISARGVGLGLVLGLVALVVAGWQGRRQPAGP